MGDDKGEILKQLSKLVASSTGKPESYVGKLDSYAIYPLFCMRETSSNHIGAQNQMYTVAVCITDNASMVFGGSDAPLALGCVYSLGAINMKNNGQIQSGVTDVLEKYGVVEGRIYINFFDMPRDCVGWNRATFAG